jgi:diguanylate cyclase (GGDEF)-like protein
MRDKGKGGDLERTSDEGFRDLTAGGRHREPCLVVVVGPAAGKVFPLAKELTSIGRSSECDIPIEWEGISRRHAFVEQGPDGEFVVVDSDSRNGTFYDGARITRHTLREGDKVQLGGSCVLKFMRQDVVDDAFHRKQYDRATRDELTGAFNRAWFHEHLAREHAFALRHDAALGVILFDVDHFKRVNDTHGHAAGDMVLRRLAELVAGTLRPEDALARVGGEEFAIHVRQSTREACALLAERIRVTVEATEFRFREKAIPVTISLGVATRQDGGSPDEILAAADRRLYAAKDGGRNRVES